MHEHIAPVLYYLQVDLLFASAVWLSAWILTSVRRGSATAKYWIWVATSLNFILPLGAVIDKLWASRLSWATPLGVLGDVGAGISGNNTLAASLFAAWLLGTALMLTRLCVRIRAERCDSRATQAQGTLELRWSCLAQGIPIRLVEAGQAPAVGGVLRSHICLPHGIEHLLTEHELSAVLIHELKHARRRDNLIRLMHEVGLCLLWFHPLVWITGHRLALYRELSCDESVIESARGADLVSALAKLASPEQGLLLQATASSFIGYRLANLTTTQPQRTCVAVNTLLALMFTAVFLGGIFETVAHTACCFVART